MTAPAFASFDRSLRRLQMAALLAAVLGLGGLVVALRLDRAVFFQSYLVGYVFWWGLALGCGAFAMLHALTGGYWGLPLRRPSAAALRTLPLLALLFVPILIGLPALYPWARPGAAHLEGGFATWFRPPWFLLRTAGYFAIWLVGGLLFARQWRPDRASPAAATRRQRLATIGLIAYVLTVTFAGVDWILGLQPHWTSTIYGLIVVAGQGLQAIAWGILIYLAGRRAGLPDPSRPRHDAADSTGEHAGAPGPAALTAVSIPRPHVLLDLGNLLLMSVALWAYLSFSQLLIMYYGNLPEEVAWYVPRFRGAWGRVGQALIALHFAAPLAVLLLRGAKRSGRAMAVLALLLLVMQFVHLLWFIVPSYPRTAWWPLGADTAAWLGIGGAWLFAFAALLRRDLAHTPAPLAEEA